MAIEKPSNAVLATNFEELYWLLWEADLGFFYWLYEQDDIRHGEENLYRFLFAFERGN